MSAFPSGSPLLEPPYDALVPQLAALLEGERDTVANLSNASALLMDALEGLNWAGFYLLREGVLVLGPFQGKPACIRIPLNRGVCGAAVERGETLVVPDVHQFPTHIACDGASRSEIVVPLRRPDGCLVGVLDVDSPLPDRFSPADRAGLEQCARLIEAACDWRI
ncbi:MAG: GAF domain-containing protein [Clostridiales bacterium]|nr:GAF domain-containing protein [Clostridiales bacterium]